MGSTTTSSDGTSTSSITSVVAVAVKGSSMGSRQAVRWAVDNLMPLADRFVLIHVIPPITSIPTPSGHRILVKELDANVVAMYKQEMKIKLEEIFLPFKTLCRTREMETLVLEDENTSYALFRYITESGCTSLVLGSSSSNYITRKLKGDQDVPSTLLEFVTNTCNIYVVSKNEVITKLANPSSSVETAGSGENMISPTKHRAGENVISPTKHRAGENVISPTKHRSIKFTRSDRQISSFRPPSIASEYEETSEASMSDLHAELRARGYTNGDSFTTAILEDNRGSNHLKVHNFGNQDLECMKLEDYDVMSPLKDDDQFVLQAELGGLQLELRTTLDMYDRACEDLVHIQKKIQTLSSECVEEGRRTRIIMEREEMWKKAAAEEKAKNLEAIKELEAAKQLLANEVHERQKAELSAVANFSERQRTIDALFLGDKRYKRYTRDEIEVATDFFSEDKKIGEGTFGKVYKCTLDHTPVAVKVLQPDEDTTKKEEFLMEVEVLSQLCHPHLVLLLGACPDIGCLVYEYMENGNLEERLFCDEGTQPLPWSIRFRIAFEVANGLKFLHGSKPEPIIHRDLKPGNILLGRNYVSKIGDVGLAKFMPSVVPDNVTEFRHSTLAGTLNYMDPEYYRTGTIRPKSDVYSFGVIILQLLTARPANGLLVSVERAINSGSFVDILDKSIPDWPLPEAEELAWLALQCSRLRCRDRPDLESLIPVLERFSNLANVQIQKANNHTPTYYFCPILQEVMEDPHIAADGFTYEYTAIKAWFQKQNVSPVTRLVLPHTMLTPNHTLRSAIEAWKKHVPSS